MPRKLALLYPFVNDPLLSIGKRSAVSYQPSAPERAPHRIRAKRSRLPFEPEC
jgi:hypothetical protein